MSEAVWFYAMGSEQRGPLDEAGMALAIGRGELGPETLVWRQGMGDWAAARTSLPGSLMPQSWADGLQRSVGMGGRTLPSAQRDVDGSAGAGSGYHHPIVFADVMRTVFSRYVLFQGRARRSEYWYWLLGIVLVSIALATIDGLIFGFEQDSVAVLSPLWSLATFLPSLGVAFRRLHDTGRSAWWLLIGFIPLLGFIVLIYWLAKRGDPGDNRYGPA